jgi:hypothetical protein
LRTIIDVADDVTSRPTAIAFAGSEASSPRCEPDFFLGDHEGSKDARVQDNSGSARCAGTGAQILRLQQSRRKRLDGQAERDHCAHRQENSLAATHRSLPD